MLLLQTIIPMPIYTNGGSSGPWTHSDTMAVVATVISLFLVQVIVNGLTALIKKENFFNLFLFKYFQDWFLPFIVNGLCYVIYGLVFVGSIIAGIYHLLT